MAIPAITSTNPVYEQIASGVAYSRSITASNTPTSYAASGLPTGLSMNTSTGAITGSPTATSATAYTISVTASNADGTSAAQSWLVVVLPSVLGVAANGFTIPVNLDLATRKLSLPGIGDPQPAARPPGASADSVPLGTWIEGERFTLSLGAQFAGVLQAVALNRIKVLWRPTGTDATIELHEDETDVSATGSGTTARYGVPVYIDPAKVRGALSDGENASGERVSGYLQIVAAASTDASDFSYSSSQAITTLTQGDSDAKTFAVTLSSTNATALEYTVTLGLVCPSDTALNCTVVRNITAHWNAGGSTYVLDTNTGDTNDTGSPTNPVNFSTTLTPTSITATSSGLSVVATATTSAMSYTGKSITVLATAGGYSDVFEIVAGETANVTGSPVLQFNDSGALSLGSVSMVDGDTAAELKTKIETAISETLVEVTYVDATTIRIVFDSGTAVADYDFAGDFSLGAPTNYPPIPSYTDATITCQVVGVEMPELFERISSQIVPHDIEMTYAV